MKRIVFSITQSVLMLLICAHAGFTEETDDPPSIIAIEGTPQTAQVGTMFPLQFKVLVSDSLGNPMPGVTVTWTPPATGPSGTFVGGISTAVTNSNGVAVSAGFIANLIAGSYVVTATASGIPNPAYFHLTNLPGAPATMFAFYGTTPQATIIDSLFPVRFKVLVRDAAGNPTRNCPVAWIVPVEGPSGTFDSAFVSVTDSNGIVEAAPFRANHIQGSYQVVARAPGIAMDARFDLTNLAGPVSVRNENAEISPTRFELQQNYPNPFNPTTNIEFRIANREFVTLKVYDLLGREVATLVNEEMTPGSYERVFDGARLASGVYLYRLQAGSFVQTKKLVLLR